MITYIHTPEGELKPDAGPLKRVGTRVYYELYGERHYGTVTEECLDEKLMVERNIIPKPTRDFPFENMICAKFDDDHTRIGWMMRENAKYDK